jgi:nitroreductase
MEQGLFEVMYSLRAMRRLKPDRVPEDVVWKVLEAGTMAPSGGNTQPWRFVVVQDAELKQFVQERYLRALRVYLRVNAEAASRREAPLDPDTATRQARTGAAALYLGEHLHEAPLLVLVCMMPRDLSLLRDAQGNVRGAAVYSSIFPAVQNMLLACRALGLGATLTTLHLAFEGEIKQRLGIPAEVETVALLPIGYPVGKFGGTTRQRVEDVTYWDGWNQLRARR